MNRSASKAVSICRVPSRRQRTSRYSSIAGGIVGVCLIGRMNSVQRRSYRLQAEATGRVLWLPASAGRNRNRTECHVPHDASQEYRTRLDARRAARDRLTDDDARMSYLRLAA